MEEGRKSESFHTTYGIVGKICGCEGGGTTIDEIFEDVVKTLLSALAGARGGTIGIDERKPKGGCGQVKKKKACRPWSPTSQGGDRRYEFERTGISDRGWSDEDGTRETTATSLFPTQTSPGRMLDSGSC
jgi:hypothetical protein